MSFDRLKEHCPYPGNTLAVMPSTHACPHCQKRCKSVRGVTQHVNQSPDCLAKQEALIQKSKTPPKRERNTDDDEDRDQSKTPPRRSKRHQRVLLPENITLPSESEVGLPPDPEGFNAFPQDCDHASVGVKPPKEEVTHAPDEAFMQDSDDEDAKREPDTSMIEEFRQYCEGFHENFLPLTKEQESSIKLIDVIRKKAPLGAFQDVMEWHLKETGKLRSHEKLGDAEGYQHRQTLMKWLFKRYNLTKMIPTIRKIRLPSSKAVVSIPLCNAKDCIVSLLTDPRFQDEDYLFFNNDPLSNPPENLLHVGDLNTGNAYLKTYERRITKHNQVLLAVPFYIDGANTGQFTDLPITALKLSLGIHNRKARDRPEAWRCLGFLPTVRPDRARGKRLFWESGHMDSGDTGLLDGEGCWANEEADNSDEDDDNSDPAVKAQDFHTMLSTILKSFVELQRTGFVWDLAYRGKVYKNVEFVIFVPFVKCDTEEADILCGKYTCRTGNVKHVCRYCHCPVTEADDPRANYKLKTQGEIERLVSRGDLDALKQISQQRIQNAWYDVAFHEANKSGIHGACPSEKLHAILLGIFKYLREIFFANMGKSSHLAEEVNSLATMYGKLLSRQSERDLPNTNFAKGIQKGKLMARDFRGVLLIMATVLRSSSGRKLLKGARKFGGDQGLKDWILLVELMLEWEAYLGEQQMERRHVHRLSKKHRFLMYIMTCVARRATGMGLKVMKFHAILHIVHDILLFGVPSETDTGSNESHHKDSKKAAKLTQRKESTFIEQTANRLLEYLCIELGMEEIVNDRCSWEYFDCGDVTEMVDTDAETNSTISNVDGSHGESDESEVETHTGGTRIQVFRDDDEEETPSFRMATRSKTCRENTVWDEGVIAFLCALQDQVILHLNVHYLPIYTQHIRGNVSFYGHPNFRSTGTPWKDWALIDWGTGWGTLPSHIWCFVELFNMPIGKEKIKFGGIDLQDGVYAVVEVGNYVQDPEEALMSDLFVPLEVEVEVGDEAGDEILSRKFYLANVEAIVGPCSVVPDVGGAKNAYFQVKRRKDWAKLFVWWLEAPHREDVMEFSGDEGSDEEG